MLFLSPRAYRINLLQCLAPCGGCGGGGGGCGGGGGGGGKSGGSGGIERCPPGRLSVCRWLVLVVLQVGEY